MGYLRCVFTCVILALFFVWTGSGKSVFQWMRPDNFDEIMDRMTTVTEENCRSKPRHEIEFPSETVAQRPRYNMLLTSAIYSNRSQLLHMHNMALNRAHFYSFIYQRLNRSVDFNFQPGLMYLYMSATADVTASQGFINGSAIFYDNHCYYPNWYNKILDFNKTTPLFGPRAWREDDYAETTNYLREPTNRTVDIHDYGTGWNSNYSSQAYKTAPWYPLWLPDLTGNQDSLTKFTYAVGIKFSNETGKFIDNEFVAIPYFGPPQPGINDNEENSPSLPVKWTKPYFDCGRSNKWIVTASAPVVEYMPRYSDFIHLRRPRTVAVSAMDIEFERIDINPCPISDGNPEPNYFAGTARCKPSTMCEVIHGFGFRRGGYQCVCKPGYYYPWWHDGPFLGLEIEQATGAEYDVGFECLQVEELMVPPNEMPSFVERKRRSASLQDRFLDLISPSDSSPRVSPTEALSDSESTRQKRSTSRKVKKLVAKRSAIKSIRERMQERRFIPRYQGEKRFMRHKRDLFDQELYARMEKILYRKQNTNKGNCRTKPDYELFLPGDAGYGAERQFEGEARTALRLSHFLCDFLQNIDEYEEFGSVRGDKRLNETHILGEVLANVMSNFKILGSGAFFDRYKFRMSPPENNTDPRFVHGITREFFGPFAYTHTAADTDGTEKFRAVDYAGFKAPYTQQRWFRDMKARWQTNFEGLEQYTAKPMVRSDPNGTSLVRWEHYPLRYFAPKYEHGEWLRPTFKCDGMVDEWVVTYVAPFFGMNPLKTRLEFHGVVTVDVKLDFLELRQCPGDYSVANAFKNTARCHFKSQYCLPLPLQTPTQRYLRGAYKCECRQGYEYPFNDLSWFFDGQMMEEEYNKMLRGEPNRYDTLKCRIAGASSVTISWLLLSLSFFLYLWNRS